MCIYIYRYIYTYWYKFYYNNYRGETLVPTQTYILSFKHSFAHSFLCQPFLATRDRNNNNNNNNNNSDLNTTRSAGTNCFLCCTVTNGLTTTLKPLSQQHHQSEKLATGDKTLTSVSNGSRFIGESPVNHGGLSLLGVVDLLPQLQCICPSGFQIHKSNVLLHWD